MPRTFRRDSPEYATGLFTETEGKDITSDSIEVGLSTSSTTPPATWQAPDATTHPTPSTVRVSLLIDTDVAVGQHYLWARLTDNPEVLVRPATNNYLNVV